MKRISSIFSYLMGVLIVFELSGCASVEAPPSSTLRIDASALASPSLQKSTLSAFAQPTVMPKNDAVSLPEIPPLKPVKSTSTDSWNPDKAKQGPVTVIISLSDQQAYIYRNGVRIAHSKVSTGRQGYETPTGQFTILQKKKKHHSNLYEDGNMPYMQRLTWDGIALHGGQVPDHPASHGCIRFPHDFARKLFGVTTIGSSVLVTDYDPGNSLI